MLFLQKNISCNNKTLNERGEKNHYPSTSGIVTDGGKGLLMDAKNHSVNGIRKQLRFIPKYPPKLFSTLTGKNTLLRW